jgi:hypothetical protein
VRIKTGGLRPEGCCGRRELLLNDTLTVQSIRVLKWDEGNRKIGKKLGGIDQLP